jgi:prolyl-tRNA editing enzyme YbaK/EbsC (Cys-tRNA(Pro) deacylase)
MMADTLPQIREFLERSGLAFEVMACAPELADTATFCAHYGVSLDHSANTILVKSKTGEESFAACLVLATMRLDVNKTVRKRLGARKASFAGPEETKSMTGMEIGGVTALGLPAAVRLWVDGEVMRREYVILGGGNRESKIKVSPAIFEAVPNTEIVQDLAKYPPPQ